MNNRIYIVYTVSAGRKSLDMLKREYEHAKISPKSLWKEKGFDDFVEFKKSWGEYTFYADVEDTGYFLDREEAINAVEENRSDIYECGFNPYLAIVPMATNVMYSCAYTEREEIMVFRYDKESERYEEMDTKGDPLARHIAKAVSGTFIPEDDEHDAKHDSNLEAKKEEVHYVQDGGVQAVPA